MIRLQAYLYGVALNKHNIWFVIRFYGVKICPESIISVLCEDIREDMYHRKSTLVNQKSLTCQAFFLSAESDFVRVFLSTYMYKTVCAYTWPSFRGDVFLEFGSGGRVGDVEIDAIIASRFAFLSRADKTPICGRLLKTLLYVVSRLRSSVW